MLSPDSTDHTVKQVSGVESAVFFPDVLEEKIKTTEFLAAARNVVQIVEKLGKIFAPVKHDMQGNIEKLSVRYAKDTEANDTLQDMILKEKTTESNLIATDALMWLTRGLHMILLFFEQIVEDNKTGKPTEDLVAFLKKAYKEALESYHGWMAQQLFSLLSRMVPTRTQLLQSLADGQSEKEDVTLRHMELYLVNLRKNVSAIQTFYKTQNLENVTVV